MSESARAATVRSLFERIDRQDYGGACNIFTDDFLYQIEPAPVRLVGYTQPGITKAKFVEFNIKGLDKDHKDRATFIERINEAGNKITVNARHRFSHEKFGTIEPKFRAEFIFRGDKVQLYKAIVDHDEDFRGSEFFKHLTSQN